MPQNDPQEVYYHRSFADDHLTPKRIDAQGRFLLNRALNIRRTIAFVGSGVSTAFGRVRWSELVSALEKDALREVDDNDELSKVLESLRRIHEPPYFSAVDRNLVRAQVASNIYRASGRPTEFHRRIKLLTRSDIHAACEQTRRLAAAFGPWDKLPLSIENQLQRCEEQQELPELFKVTVLRDHFVEFSDKQFASNAGLQKALQGSARLLDSLNSNVAGSITPPDVRILYDLIGMLFVAHRIRPFDDSKWHQWCRPIEGFVGSPRPIADPIRKLHRTLDIRRFLTTNYDFELERYLETAGYPSYALRPGPPKSESESGSANAFPSVKIQQNYRGDRARSSVLRDDTAADLIDFASGTSEFDFDVFHLHGRAADEDPLIVTERDYQNTYLAEEASRHIFQESLRVAFAGNPILFVGLGMSEQDLLRPLRQFVSNAVLYQNHSLFALLPAYLSADERSEVSLTLYLRYGVHAIFFGHESEVGEHLVVPPERLCKLEAQSKRFVSTETTDLQTAIEQILTATSAAYEPSSVPGVTLSLLKEIASLGQDRLQNLAADEKVQLRVGAFQSLTALLHTSELCRFLDRISTDNRQWWSRWRAPIAARPAYFQNLVRGGDRGRTCFVRHYIVENSASESHAELARIEKMLKLGSKNSKRRIFIVTGPVGAGKGALVQAVIDRFRGGGFGQYKHAFFANTRLSSEFSSVVDRLTQFLYDPTGKSRKVPEDAVSRLHLRACMKQAIARKSGRFLIVISGVELLFEADGRPKSTSFADMFEELLTKTNNELNGDVILFVREDRADSIFGVEAAEGRGMRSLAKFPDASKCRVLTLTHELDTTLKHVLHWASRNLDVSYCNTIPISDLLKCVLDNLKVIRSRVLFTMVVACCVAHQRIDPQHRLLGGWREWLQDLGAQVSVASDERRSEVVVTAAISLFSDLLPHRGGLADLILRHLAVFSLPAEAAVLEACPLISAKIKKGDESAQILSVLHDLKQFGLVFEVTSRIAEHEGASEEASSRRFALHGAVQRTLLKNTGMPHVELRDSHLFAVSMYASQPLDLPTPTREAYRFLEDLVNALIDYPSGGSQDAGPQPFMAFRYRAALGVLRTVFSIGVITRYSGHNERREDGFGHLEAHRLRLRWLLYRALAISGQEDEADDVIMPFYRDEIAWLYNECAIISFMQGNLYDALPLFDLAERECKKAEGSSLGPNGVRVALNRAPAEIERGHFSRVEKSLKRIRDISISPHRHGAKSAATKVESTTIWRIATGYLGLAAHLQGRVEEAKLLYDQALAHVEEDPDAAVNFRVFSVFYRHRGDLQRLLGRNSDAKSDFALAVARAESAQQQDLLQHVRISQALLAGKQEAREDRVSALRMLDAAELYADCMEIPRIKAEALLARADIMLGEGETRLGGELAVHALSISTLHGLRLRIVTALLKVAQVTMMRGGVDAASLIMRTARAAAERFRFQLSVERAEQIALRIATMSRTTKS